MAEFEVFEPPAEPQDESWREDNEPCDHCGGRVVWVSGHSYYNGSYSCYTATLDCENCGTYDIECV